MFAEFMHGHFREVFRNSDKAKDKLLLQDGDLLKNNRKVINAMFKVGARNFSVLAWWIHDISLVSPTQNVLKQLMYNVPKWSYTL